MSHSLSYGAIVDGLVAQGVPKDKAEAAAAAETARSLARAGPPATASPTRIGKAVGTNGFDIPSCNITRDRDTLTARYDLPPRTKKNSTMLGIVQSPAYRRFCQGVVDATNQLRGEFSLPIPDAPYNLAAVFYVDKPGERADLIGLIQGTADALQEAKVVSDDKWFKTLDGCRIVVGDPTPRVEVVITPIED